MSERERLQREVELALSGIPKDDAELFREACEDLTNLMQHYPGLLFSFSRMLVHRMVNGK